jgi:hypothetical protein
MSVSDTHLCLLAFERKLSNCEKKVLATVLPPEQGFQCPTVKRRHLATVLPSEQGFQCPTVKRKHLATVLPPEQGFQCPTVAESMALGFGLLAMTPQLSALTLKNSALHGSLMNALSRLRMQFLNLDHCSAICYSDIVIQIGKSLGDLETLHLKRIEVQGLSINVSPLAQLPKLKVLALNTSLSIHGLDSVLELCTQLETISLPSLEPFRTNTFASNQISLIAVKFVYLLDDSELLRTFKDRFPLTRLTLAGLLLSKTQESIEGLADSNVQLQLQLRQSASLLVSLSAVSDSSSAFILGICRHMSTSPLTSFPFLEALSPLIGSPLAMSAQTLRILQLHWAPGSMRRLSSVFSNATSMSFERSGSTVLGPSSLLEAVAEFPNLTHIIVYPVQPGPWPPLSHCALTGACCAALLSHRSRFNLQCVFRSRAEKAAYKVDGLVATWNLIRAGVQGTCKVQIIA